MVKHGLLNEIDLVYAITAAGSIPTLSLIALHLRHRRMGLAITAGIGALASLIVFTLVFIAPWIYVQGYGYTLWGSWELLKVAGDVFAKAVALASIFSALGATLWLAELGGGKEVFAVASSIGFAISIAFVASATGLSVLGGMPVERIGIGAWASIALFALGIVITVVNRRQRVMPSKGVASATHVNLGGGSEEHDIAKSVLEEAKKVVSKS